MMNLIYNSANFSIFAYPASQCFELFNKEGKKTVFLQGEEAVDFCQQIKNVSLATKVPDSVDDFLAEFTEDMGAPVVFH